MNNIEQLTRRLVEELDRIEDPDVRIDCINTIREAIWKVSPMKDEPIDFVRWVLQTEVVRNDYNPNTVAPPEMKLLEHSILSDGYTQPIVVFLQENGTHEIVDGFHRSLVGQSIPEIRDRVRNRLPVTTINLDRIESKDRMASTIRHNRARGVHGIASMAEIVSKMYFNGWSNTRIARELGMGKDEVLRLKQVTGLGSLFENREFSPAWDLLVEGK